jgi:osmotically-inducible protein OsmY
MSDLTVKQAVEAELQWEPSVDAAAIGVAVKDGIVTLTGHVETLAEKMAAAHAAAPGVAEVENYVAIAP